MLMVVTSFVLGVVAILGVEAVGLLLFLRRLNRRSAEQHQTPDSGASPLHHDPAFTHKQGDIWILESENAIKDGHVGSVPKRNLEVCPVQKQALLKQDLLYISESDGSRTQVKLRGCTVLAVSATTLPSRKWAKRFPIKVESKVSFLYNGSKILYIFLDTSWEKESWCKALRLASCDDQQKLKWFSSLNFEFRRYVSSLSSEYPSFMKPSGGLSADPVDKSMKLDGSSSKVRQFLKNLAKKTSKSGIDSKTSTTLPSINEEKNNIHKSRSLHDCGVTNMAVLGKVPENMSSLSIGPNLVNSVGPDLDADEKTPGDEGTLCWNLLLSRLFFDVRGNGELRSSIKARIQRMLSNMRSPSYIGEITCTSVDPGNLPPYIHAMRVLPSHMDDLWAFDLDIEYSGGAILNIETRVEVQELNLHKEEDESFGSSAVDQVTSDLLESFVDHEGNLKLPEERADKVDKREGEAGIDAIGGQKNTMRSSSQSRWKSLLHSVAKQVSQVPLSLGVGVSCIRGTLRVYIKPPPSDRIWVGFTSMPDIDFNLESFIGDHKVTNTHIAVLLINRLKVSIRESLVLPNCESICIPWMLAEKEDWVPRSVAPLMWIKQDPGGGSTNTKQGGEKSSSGESGSNDTEGSERKSSAEGGPMTESKNESAEEGAFDVDADVDLDVKDELRTPLLRVDEDAPWHQGKPAAAATSQSLMLNNEIHKRMGTRAKVLGFGKKMGEKLEEKRRHIEERGRILVERMKGPQ